MPLGTAISVSEPPAHENKSNHTYRQMSKDVHFSIVRAAKAAEVQRERKRMPSNGAMLNKLYITIEQHVIRLSKKQSDRAMPNDSGSL